MCGDTIAPTVPPARIHDLDITKWPNTIFAKWAVLVDQTPAMEWNRKFVDPAQVFICSAKLTASSLT
jgi:hypothetical protein